MQKLKYKNILNNLLSKILTIILLLTIVIFYLPVNSFAEDTDSKSDSNKKSPALVPIAADEIISKFVKTNIYGKDSDNNSNNSGSSMVITDNKDKGNGWNSVTKVKYDNGVERTYRNYKQGKWYGGEHDYWNYSYWGGIIQDTGCGPTAVSIVLSGYGYDANPRKVVQVMNSKFHKNSSDSFENLREPLKYIGNIKAEDHYGTVNSAGVQKMRENLKKGRPIIANVPGHYVVCLGLDKDGNVIISDPGASDSVKYKYGKTLEEFASHITCGYIQILSDENASKNSEDNKSEDNKKDEKKSEDNKKDEKKSEDNKKDEKKSDKILRWPIGSNKITTKNGKKFAEGTPAIGTSNVSRGGVSRGWSNQNHTRTSGGEALDIHGNRKTNFYNIVAMADGTVTSCGDGIPDGSNGNRRNG